MLRRVAERLVTDIRHRGLTVGDRYLTTVEVGQSLGVGKDAASKVMRHLAEQQILISRRRSGTFIGPASTNRHSKVKTVYVLVSRGRPGGHPVGISAVYRGDPESNAGSQCSIHCCS